VARVLALIFIVVPFIELFVLLQVGQAIGVVETIGLLIVVSVVGAWLVKREGIGVYRRAQVTMAEGRVPAAELLDGVLILFAGALLLTPGFLTDVLGVSLLVPPVRAGVRQGLRRYLARRVRVYRSLQ
jgi:UPF0716 protein FxsA